MESRRESAEATKEALLADLSRDGYSNEAALSSDPASFHTSKGETMSQKGISLSEGWRSGVLLSSLVTLLILIFNVTLTIWSTLTYGTVDGVGTGASGSCHVVDAWAFGLRLLINVLGTALLSISNYTMQCLVSPSREDLDSAHGKGAWLDIGRSGLRNVFYMSRSRTVLWLLLAISSIPVHLLYNSTIFKTLDAEVYSVVAASNDFLSDSGFNHKYLMESPHISGSHLIHLNSSEIRHITDIQKQYKTNQTTFQNLTNYDCIESYGQSIVSGRSNVILVVDPGANAQSDSVFFYESVDSFQKNALPYAWICQDQDGKNSKDGPALCDTFQLEQNTSEWTINSRPIQYCLSEKVAAHCKLQFSIYMMTAVIICNAMKLVAMIFTLRQHREKILVTLGDAISSFLQQPDERTKDQCLLDVQEVRKAVKNKSLLSLPTPHFKQASLRRVRRYESASLLSWTVSGTALLLTLAILAAYLGKGAYGFAHYQGSAAIFWNIGFGAIDSRALVDSPLPNSGYSGLVSSVLISNLPQLLLSFVYLSYNGVFTSMLLAKEWFDFGSKRSPLRVSKPAGEQLSTRWLSLPYRYSLPLLTVSSASHWLTSNSLFLVRLSIYNGDNLVRNISQLGWSPIPMLSLILLGLLMIAGAAVVGLKRFETLMPTVGSCSFAIAAACHAVAGEDDASLHPLQWGEVSLGVGESSEAGHCSFSENFVEEPTKGRWYAGSHLSKGVS